MTHGHGQQCSDMCREAGMRRLNGNGKNTIKIKIKYKEIFIKQKKKKNSKLA